MKTISCIAIDDEPLALTVITEYVSKIPYLNLIKTFNSPTEAAHFIQTEKPELMFLDIQMPEIRGTDFAKTLLYKPAIILTTAYSEYALEGFDIDAIDYLVKPIPFNRFIQGVNKAIRLLGSTTDEKETSTELQHEKEFLFVKSGYKSVKIEIGNILYIEAMKEYATIFTHEHKFIRHGSLKSLQQLLQSNTFIRVHKSYIVNISKVKAFYGNTIEIGAEKIPIGRAYKEEVNQHLK
nr:LytTR family DNA-binding domain-containing protein [uncultured Carboxylicivirga sp.]